MDQIIQIVGAILILSGFIGAQVKAMSPQSLLYLVLNLVGSIVLTIVAFIGTDWGFVLLEGVWAMVSFWGLLKVLRGEPALTP
jgi:hypothetical protein